MVPYGPKEAISIVRRFNDLVFLKVSDGAWVLSFSYSDIVLKEAEILGGIRRY